MENKSQVAIKPDFKTALIKIQDTYVNMVNNELAAHQIDMTPYGKVCLMNAIGTINDMLIDKGLSFNSPEIDSSSLTQIFNKITTLELNTASTNREVYFQLRNVKVGSNWIKRIEMGIEGDGNDKILSKFGRDVKKVYPYWLVRENDEFTYPYYEGIKCTPPTWKPKGTGKVIRVVYPIEYNDGSIVYHIGERDDVFKNLYAHISNNLMNETFGICEDRFKATPEQKNRIAVKKEEILKKVAQLKFDVLNSPEFSKYISAAWSEPNATENMFIRKMRNNTTKIIPKDFGTSYVALNYEKTNRDFLDGEVVEVSKELTFDNTTDVNAEQEQKVASKPDPRKVEEPKAEKPKEEPKATSQPEPVIQAQDDDDELPPEGLFGV